MGPISAKTASVDTGNLRESNEVYDAEGRAKAEQTVYTGDRVKGVDTAQAAHSDYRSKDGTTRVVQSSSSSSSTREYHGDGKVGAPNAGDGIDVGDNVGVEVDGGESETSSQIGFGNFNPVAHLTHFSNLVGNHLAKTAQNLMGNFQLPFQFKF